MEDVRPTSLDVMFTVRQNKKTESHVDSTDEPWSWCCCWTEKWVISYELCLHYERWSSKVIAGPFFNSGWSWIEQIALLYSYIVGKCTATWIRLIDTSMVCSTQRLGSIYYAYYHRLVLPACRWRCCDWTLNWWLCGLDQPSSPSPNRPHMS